MKQRIRKRATQGVVMVILAASILPGLVTESAAIDANRWLALSDPEKSSYVTAAVDAWFNFHAVIKHNAAAQRTSAEATFFDLVECINRRKFNYDQIFQATRDYVERRTDRRTYNMTGVTWNAVSEMCKS